MKIADKISGFKNARNCKWLYGKLKIKICKCFANNDAQSII